MPVGPPDGSDVNTTVFFDNGATITLCTHDWAEKAGLQGQTVPEEIESLGGKVLGLGYCPETDVIKFKLEPVMIMAAKKN